MEYPLCFTLLLVCCFVFSFMNCIPYKICFEDIIIYSTENTPAQNRRLILYQNSSQRERERERERERGGEGEGERG